MCSVRCRVIDADRRPRECVASVIAAVADLDDLNVQLRQLDTVANPRVHATTQRVVNDAFAEEKPALKPLPLAPYRTVLSSLPAHIAGRGAFRAGPSGNQPGKPLLRRPSITRAHEYKTITAPIANFSLLDRY